MREPAETLRDLPVQEFRENLVDESVLAESRENPSREHRDTTSSSLEVPMELRAKVESGSGKHSVCTHIPKDPHCDICLKTKITRASCRRRAGTVVPRARNIGDLITADHKFLSEESDIIDVQSWYKIWQLSGYNPTRVKQKLLRKPRRALRSSWSRQGN